MPRSEPKLSQFGPAFVWLLEKEVSASRLADLFHTTAGNIRVIAFRARHAAFQTAEEPPLDQPPTPKLACDLGVRPIPDEVVRTSAGTRKLDWLRSEIESSVVEHTRRYSFLDGVRALRDLAPQIGYAADARRIALLAELQQSVAWFLVHAGRCRSAARQAREARNLWRIAYHEAPSREYAERFIQSALIGSHSLLLARRPQDALHTLEVARSAAESIGAPIGSDHFRQRGVALFQLREYESAAAEFRESAEAMERLGEAQIPAQVLMTGMRHINLLGHVNWDGACEIFETATREFGGESLEASMALHWSVACGLSTDSTASFQQAVDLLAGKPSPAPQFGHQITIRKLLAITPELGFDDRLRRAWVRRTLYENAFRAR